MPKNKLGPPKEEADFSSNWKKLQATLQTNPKKRKTEGGEERVEHKRRKLGGDEAGHSKKPAAKPANGAHSGKNSERREGGATGKEASQKTEKKNEIWFDDVDEMLLERPASSRQGQNSLTVENAVTHATKALAMDCEMVGIGKDGEESILARVSIVNQHGHCVYDKFVKPREIVTDYRTHVSGVRPYNLRHAEEFVAVQKAVSDFLKGKILVGHALHNDLKVLRYVLFLDHPRREIRDTARFKPFRQLFGGRNPSLKKLTAKVLGVSVQQGEHNSVQDAQAAMRLYMRHRQRWEKELAAHYKGKRKKTPGKKKKMKTVETKKVAFAETSK
ncbi:hypothetical protein ACOMHN_033749 [Nucella lapillus]